MSALIFCAHCGETIYAHENICPHCGAENPEIGNSESKSIKQNALMDLPIREPIQSIYGLPAGEIQKMTENEDLQRQLIEQLRIDRPDRPMQNKYGLPPREKIKPMFKISSFQSIPELSKQEESKLRREIQHNLSFCNVLLFSNNDTIHVKLSLVHGAILRPDLSTTGLTSPQQKALGDAIHRKRLSIKYTGSIQLTLQVKH